MKRDEFKKEIEDFKNDMIEYQKVVCNNEVHRDYNERFSLMEKLCSQLNQKYGKLEKYIDHKQISGEIGQTYLKALGSITDTNAVNAMSNVVSNIDRIIGRLDAMSDKEFDILLTLQKQETIHGVKNPHKEYFGMLFNSIWGWIKKPVSKVVIGVIIIVIGAFFLAWLGFKQ